MRAKCGICFNVLAVCLIGVLFSCSKEDRRLNKAGQAAVVYYTCLKNGQYARFVDGMLSCDSAPETFRAQMVVLTKQFAMREKELNGGIKTVVLDRESIMSDGRSAEVFLDLTYNNNTQEEVVLPMIYKDGEWRMQ